MPVDMETCIQDCTDCAHICLETMNHCLQMGGKHADATHIRTLADCAEICATSANFMLRHSELHTETCRACWTVCERCALSCETISGDEMMQRCAQACRRCAQSCRQMSETPGRRAA